VLNFSFLLPRKEMRDVSYFYAKINRMEIVIIAL
jgi:hypothetical protein